MQDNITNQVCIFPEIEETLVLFLHGKITAECNIKIPFILNQGVAVKHYFTEVLKLILQLV